MQYTISFDETKYHELTSHLFDNQTNEQAAYLLCSLSSSAGERRLLVRHVLPVRPSEIEDASPRHMTIPSQSFLRAIKRADGENHCFIFVHSHPSEFPQHSTQDDREEPNLFRTAYNRIHNSNAIHASVVFSSRTKPSGRVWLENGERAPISRFRVIGNEFLFYDSGADEVDFSAFDRQVLAFGSDVQGLLRRLTIGIVGLGGTGSAVAEQLIRLGVGRLVVCDPQVFEPSNVNRVYGSRVSDEMPKVELIRRLADCIGLGTRVDVHQGSITDLLIAREFRECDVIFGCTDDEWGRAILSRMAVSYLIPVFDTGVKIDSKDGTIKSVSGRVTTLFPTLPCLFCRGTITGDVITAEIKQKYNPSEYEALRREGYVAELPGVAPSVIMFTSTVASMAITELLQRLTGFMGHDRQSTELLVRFDESRISRTSRSMENGCWCTDQKNWATGDVEPFLDMTWITANL
jgi:molybdopterin/thiamine biosynthesis adenylyltransferase